ncbi:MAG: hypothetical protein E8D47_04550 [Nitrospira sp.]|nr:MAG: hypothetical protein E8D47_04550 [Nitrospira sp.]
MFGLSKKKLPQPPREFPPVPKWRPSIRQPLDRVVERVAHYTDQQRDFVVFEYGTCVLVQDGLSEEEAAAQAKDLLSKIFNFHPDMNPGHMKDGNITVQYNEPALNVVLEDIVQLNWAEIERNHQDALVASEVLMTPLGPNKFDDFGKKALLGRCYMFMDAQDPKVVRIERAAV